MHPDEGPLPLDWYTLGRWAAYVAALVVAGSVVFSMLARRAGLDGPSLRRRIGNVALGAGLLLLAADLLRLYGQAHSFVDPGEPLTSETVRSIVIATSWGLGWRWQVGTAIFVIVAAWRSGRSGGRGSRWGLGLAALAVIGVTPLTGHAVENPWGPAIGVALHATHLLAAATWLGTLFLLVRVGLHPGAEPDEVARLVNRFSPIALTGAAVASGAGLLLALAYIGTISSLVGSTYGRTLLIKTATLLLVASLGAFNWRRVKPRLGLAGATGQLRRSARLELLAGALLLAVTAVLVALPAPRI